MKNKKLLLILFLLITFIALPTTCNAEEVPPLKWEELSEDYGETSTRTGLHNINNNILVVHNTGGDTDRCYVRLYNNSGEKKWEYNQGYVTDTYFIINNEYLGLINEPGTPLNKEKIITLLNIKDGTIYKKIDISKIVNDLKDTTSSLIYSYYYNNKIILLFYDVYETYTYNLFTVDLNGNIELIKSVPYETRFYINKQIGIGNTIYNVKDNNITAISADTGELISTTPINDDINIYSLIEYKDGIMFTGSKNGYMAITYYNLKTGSIQTKQFDKEGTIYSVSTDNKDNLYIAGQYIDDNTTGKAYFSKYTNNNWNFQKVYESFYEKEKYEEYFYTDMLVLKNNKLILAGNTNDFGKYRYGYNYITLYDGTKNYKIDKVIKGNGNIDIVESEEENNEVKYKIKPAFGYKLISLKIVTESGKEIEVSDDYSFIMPDENITITATFEPIINNPITGNNLISLILETAIFITFIYGTTKCIKKNRNQINSEDYKKK